MPETDRDDDLSSATHRSDHGVPSLFSNFIRQQVLFKVGRDVAVDIDETFPRTIDLQDPFELAVSRIVEMRRRKKADYNTQGNPFDNFEDTAHMMGLDGFTEVEAAFFNVLQKASRIRSLRKQGKLDDPTNESVTDTYLDMAVYSVICYALHLISIGEADSYDTEDCAD